MQHLPFAPVLRLKGKLGEKAVYTGRILAVGISYERKSKKHSCKIEDISNSLACLPRFENFQLTKWHILHILG